MGPHYAYLLDTTLFTCLHIQPVLILYISTIQYLSVSVATLLGTLIGVKPACQFAAATGASVCHHDMSIPSLAADYDPLTCTSSCALYTGVLSSPKFLQKFKIP